MAKDQQQSDEFPKTGNPAQNALTHAGYTRLSQLTQVTEAEVAALHGMGPKAMRILREALAARGLAFAPAQPPKRRTAAAKTPAAATAGDWPKLAAPARRALAGAGYTRLAQLARVTEAEVAALHGMGPNAVATLRAALRAQGLAFAAPKRKA